MDIIIPCSRRISEELSKDYGVSNSSVVSSSKSRIQSLLKVSKIIRKVVCGIKTFVFLQPSINENYGNSTLKHDLNEVSNDGDFQEEIPRGTKHKRARILANFYSSGEL